jgi:hypothetical protein
MWLAVAAATSACSSQVGTPAGAITSPTIAKSRSVPAASSTAAPPGTPSSSIRVAWTKDGRLVVIDSATGTEGAELGRVQVGTTEGQAPAAGPLGVIVTPDARTAIVWWRDTEPGCGFHVGTVRTDGSGPVITIGHGFDVVLSPDGTKVAWHEIATSCTSQALVVHALADGTQQRVEIPSTINGYQFNIGPFWQNDNRTIVYQPPTLRPVYRAFDAVSMTQAGPVVHVEAACVDTLHRPTVDPAPKRDGDVFAAGPQPKSVSATRTAGC